MALTDISMLAYIHFKWGLVSKLLIVVFLWHPLDFRHTKVGFKLISVEVCTVQGSHQLVLTHPSTPGRSGGWWWWGDGAAAR